MLQFQTEELLVEIVCKLRHKVVIGQKITESKYGMPPVVKLD
jgi:hypothetical protein